MNKKIVFLLACCFSFEEIKSIDPIFGPLCIVFFAAAYKIVGPKFFVHSLHKIGQTPMIKKTIENIYQLLEKNRLMKSLPPIKEHEKNILNPSNQGSIASNIGDSDHVVSKGVENTTTLKSSSFATIKANVTNVLDFTKYKTADVEKCLKDAVNGVGTYFKNDSKQSYQSKSFACGYKSVPKPGSNTNVYVTQDRKDLHINTAPFSSAKVYVGDPKESEINYWMGKYKGFRNGVIGLGVFGTLSYWMASKRKKEVQRVIIVQDDDF